MDDAGLMRLYEHLADRRRAQPQTVRDMPREARNAYHAEANRRSRAKAKAAREAGIFEPTRPMIRNALADAAIMLLATDGPGADQIRAALAGAFPGKPGVSMTVTQHARAGKLKPKLL